MTNLELISDAYRLTGITGEGETPSAEQGQDGLRKLNQVMAMWTEDALTFPSWVPQTSLSAACPIPDWAEKGVTGELAVALAAHFGVDLSDAAIAQRESGVEVIRRRRIVQQMQPIDLSHLPQGEGSYHTWDYRHG